MLRETLQTEKWCYVLFLILIVSCFFNTSYFALIIIAIFAGLIFYYLVSQAILLKKILFGTIIKESSSLINFTKTNVVIYIINLIISILFALALYIFIYSNLKFIPLILFFPIILLPLISKWLFSKVSSHIRNDPSLYITRSLSCLCIVILLLLLAILCKLTVSSFIDTGILSTSNSMATYVINNHQHGVKWIQDLVRTSVMFDLELIRAWFLAEGMFSFIVYIYYLVPSIISIFGIVYSFYGLTLLKNKTQERI